LAAKLDNGVLPADVVQENFEKLQMLVEYSLVARSEMLGVSNRLSTDKDKPIHSRDLMILKKGTEDYLSIRKDLLSIASSFECGLEVSDETLIKYGINDDLKMKGLMLSLGAALTLYDNYLLGVMLFEQDSRLRKLINDPDMGFGLVGIC